jgi:hypothetical protein
MAVPRGYFERGGLDHATLRAEVEALRAEVERLKSERSIREMHGHQWIPDERVDAAWTRASVRSLRVGQPENDGRESLAELGIVECPNCWDGERFDVRPEDCPICHGHGWIREERGDE